jgi:two-component system, OmpR family, response regulator BaeR
MAETQQQILIVEDETKLAQLLNDYLQRAGFDTQSIDNGLEVMPRIQDAMPDLILLDLMLPGRDGLDICRDIRSFSQVPVIMITARVEEIDRLLGLELGADDYICKPFSPREVIARVKAVLRRTTATEPGDATSPELELIEESYRVRLSNNAVDLTSVEFQLFAVLYQHPGRIYSRSQLMDRIYDDGRIVSDRTIDSHIKKLRRKLTDLVPDQELIHSVYGAGYRYEPAPKDTVGN